MRTKRKVNLHGSEEYTILKNVDNCLKIEIDTTKSNVMDIIKQIDEDEIIDINISNIPLENIITEIYKK